MKNKDLVKTGLLSLAGVLSMTAQAETQSQDALTRLRVANANALGFDDLAGGSCYGLPCPGGTLSLNCSDEVIKDNLDKLESLNIIEVGELSPFACTGYCISNTLQGRQADKCEKAEALAKLVELVEPLAVSIKY